MRQHYRELAFFRRGAVDDDKRASGSHNPGDHNNTYRPSQLFTRSHLANTPVGCSSGSLQWAARSRGSKPVRKTEPHLKACAEPRAGDRPRTFGWANPRPSQNISRETVAESESAFGGSRPRPDGNPIAGFKCLSTNRLQSASNALTGCNYREQRNLWPKRIHKYAVVVQLMGGTDCRQRGFGICFKRHGTLWVGPTTFVPDYGVMEFQRKRG